MFFVTVSRYFEWFQYFTTLNENLRILKSSFLVESTKTENVLFLYKTAISEANVKTNGTVSKKWTFHKERSFASNYFTFFEIFVSVYEPLIKRWFHVPMTQMPIFLLFVSAGVLFDRCFTPASILNMKDPLNTFDDFKKQRKCMKCFLIHKSM